MLVRFEQHCQALHRANRMFVYTFSQLHFNSAKLVELQNKNICEGLESEHYEAAIYFCTESVETSLQNVTLCIIGLEALNSSDS
ncbi:hypothetical protein AOLI_G00098110 [Acnodon oligacanthus]